MYGDPVISVNPAPAPIVQTSPTTPEATPVELNEATPTTPITPAPVAEETPAKTDPETAITEESGDAVYPLTYLAPAQKNISNLDTLLNGSAGWALYATVFVLGVLAFSYLYRHITFINAVVSKGEHAIAAHPLLESSLIFIVLWLLLSASHGAVL